MKLFASSSFALILASVAGIAGAQTTLVNDWVVNAAASPNPIIQNSGDATRGMDIKGGNVLIASRVNSSNTVYRLNPATGAEVTPALPNAGYTGGGTFVINKVQVADDGVIYVCNLAAATSTFNIYRHATETSASTISYTEVGAAARLGDDMDAFGSGNGTKLLVGQSGFATVSIFTTADAGVTLTKTTVTPSNPAIAGSPQLSWDPSGTSFWFRNTSSSNLGGQYDAATGVGNGQNTPRPTSSLYGPIYVGPINANTFYALGPGNTPGGNTIIQGEIYRTSDLTVGASVYVSNSIRQGAGYITNGNGAGDVVLDDSTDKVYWLVTNNVIARDSIPAGISDWNIQ